MVYFVRWWRMGERGEEMMMMINLGILKPLLSDLSIDIYYRGLREPVPSAEVLVHDPGDVLCSIQPTPPEEHTQFRGFRRRGE